MSIGMVIIGFFDFILSVEITRKTGKCRLQGITALGNA
jgi:hypothetical protein